MTRPLVAAHRGVASGAAENTLAAFTAAIDIGADMVEFDVRRTRDGELIVFHDARAGGAAVGSLTRDQIASAAGVRPPLLAEVLGACAGRIMMDVELKEDGYVPEVMAALRAFLDSAAIGAGQLVVTSFLPAVVAQAKDALPEVKTGLLVGGASARDIWSCLRALRAVRIARQVRADYLAPHHGLAGCGVVRRAAAAGLSSLVWTVNDDEAIRRCAADPAVAAIITDEAARALAIVGRAPGRG
jgi:glycerophosphoryl diester phosphodiesterase